jgi:hypothetical protein
MVNIVALVGVVYASKELKFGFNLLIRNNDSSIRNRVSLGFFPYRKDSSQKPGFFEARSLVRNRVSLGFFPDRNAGSKKPGFFEAVSCFFVVKECGIKIKKNKRSRPVA